MSTVRPASPADARAATDLWTAAYVTEGGGGRTEPYVEQDFLDATERGAVLVAERDDAVIGVVVLLPPGESGRAVARDGEAELSRLAVTAPARGRGVGRTLVLCCEGITRAEGWPAIALWSRPYQTAAHQFYESLGYRRMPDRDTVDETGHGRLVFVLDLTSMPG